MLAIVSVLVEVQFFLNCLFFKWNISVAAYKWRKGIINIQKIIQYANPNSPNIVGIKSPNDTYPSIGKILYRYHALIGPNLISDKDK